MLIPVALTLLALALVPATPAAAAGTSYSPVTWAGVRSFDWRPDPTQPWRAPRRVHATWQIPCLPSADDGVYGAYDQWIGIESTDGHVIQAGVRSYHLNFGFGVQNGYFAWVTDTLDASARTPRALFNIYNCGQNGPYAEVIADVDAGGYAHISGANLDKWGASRNPAPYLGPGIGAVSAASFIVERFSTSESIPWFGSASFRDCKIGVGNSAWVIGPGTPNTSYPSFQMASLNRRPPWLPALPAVLSGTPDQYGTVNLRQWFVN